MTAKEAFMIDAPISASALTHYVTIQEVPKW